MNTYLTFDVGGSAIKYALIQEDLTIVEKSSVPTPLDTLDNFVETIGKIYDKYKDNIKGIAMSMPGIIDPDKGYQYTGGALRYIADLNTVELLQQRCPINMTIGNDAKCAANAEIGYGSLQDIQDGAVVILGTGIGGCLIKDHQVHTGKHFSAGEFSFIKTDFHDALTWDSAWSTRNGITGLLARVQEQLETDEEYSGFEIFELANNGNEKVMEGINQFAFEVATQIFNVHIIFDCEKVAIGGGISVQPLLIELIQKNLDNIFDHLGFGVFKPEIVPCHFRNDANLIGALYQHIQTYKKVETQ
ncbi:MAG: ROK family protein [Erysipelotrichaceae bacterium]|nr:ROK family protein [Erysipelotrichaceae bacterium]